MSTPVTNIDADRKYRLITRSDMDGLVCAILLKELNLISDILFAHPKDMQDGLIEVTENDITTNLPYVPGVGMCFDHHTSEAKRNENTQVDNYIIDPKAPSAARVVYDYYGGKETFPRISDEMMIAVDKADSAAFTKEDILDSQGWELLSFIMDARTGLGRFRNFTISNYQLMMQLIDYCREHNDIKDILALPDVKERVDIYKSHQIKARQQIESAAHIHGKTVVLDLRDKEPIYAANRFMVYALFPNCNISVHVLNGKNNQNTVFAVGKSILNRTNQTNIGPLMLEYGGGGHEAAGTCQVDNNDASKILSELLPRLQP
jgi:nanoRNase/pAp phosphatase (c-di-AMP/oligoRNAs hydrolase)